MGLIGNVLLENRLPSQYLGSATISNDKQAFAVFGARQNKFTGETYDQLSAVPSGTLPPYSWELPLKGGGMASFTLSRGAITGTASVAGGRNLEGSSTCAITLTNAQLDQIVSAVASGSLSISAASAALAAAAGISGSSSMQMSLVDALCGAIFSVTASSSMATTPDATISALAHMEAEAGGATPLSPEGLAASLLDENDIETGYSLREATRLILASLAGKVSGAGTTTITIRDINDGKNRVVATVDSNGNRESVTLDASE